MAYVIIRVSRVFPLKAREMVDFVRGLVLLLHSTLLGNLFASVATSLSSKGTYQSYQEGCVPHRPGVSINQ